ncbi:hypothetical protein ScPMuIL_014873 [Solemya velum]
MQYTLKELWEFYYKIIKTFSGNTDFLQTKNVSLDIFLSRCLVEIEESGGIPKICDMKTMCNQLCQEFMSDIVNVTSATEDEEDSTALETYMLKDRGWVLLHVIYKSGVQGLSGSRDFSNLLVSLLPWCLKFSSCTTDPDTPKTTDFQPMSSCFHTLYKLQKWQNCLKQREQVIPSSRKRLPHRVAYRSKDEPLHRKKLVRTIPISEECNSSNSEGNVSDSVQSSSRYRRSQKRSDFDDLRETFAYHQHDNSNSDEEDDSQVWDIMSSFKKDTKVTTPFKLCTMILNLLSDLCLLDLDQVSQMKFISSSVLPHLLHVISSFHSTDDSVDSAFRNWNNQNLISFQRQLVRLLIMTSGIIATQQNGINVLIGNKTVPILLDVAMKLLRSQKIIDILNGNCEDQTDCGGFVIEQWLLTDIVLGLVMCLDISFQCLPFNPLFINSSVCLVEDFVAGYGFQLLKTIIQWHDSSKLESTNHQSQWLDDEPIKVISSFLNTLKVVKVNYIHAMKCVKRKHQKCQYSHYFDHHHDILGIGAACFDKDNIYSTSRMFLQTDIEYPRLVQTKCLVAAWTEFLLDLLPMLKSKYLQVDLFKNIYLFGVCCCMLPNALIKIVTSCLPSFSPGVRCYVLDILNRLLLEQFSGGEKTGAEKELTNSVMCQTCDIVEEKVQADNKISGTPLYLTFDSGISSSDINEMSKIYCPMRSPKWRSLQELRSLLFCDDALAVRVAKQLLGLSIKGKTEVKEELFFSIYMYTLGSFLCPSSHFISSDEDDNTAEEKSLSRSVQVHCLSALPYLLQCDCVMKSFLTKKEFFRCVNCLTMNNFVHPCYTY